MFTGDLVWRIPLDNGNWQGNLTAFGLWALAIAVVYLRGSLNRRRPVKYGRGGRAWLVGLAAALFVGGSVGGCVVGRDLQRRQEHQAQYLSEQWGIMVIDVDRMPGVAHAGQGVPLEIESSSAVGGARQHCTLSSYFCTGRDRWSARKPGRGGGNGLMLFRLSCPAPFTTHDGIQHTQGLGGIPPQQGSDGGGGGSGTPG